MRIESPKPMTREEFEKWIKSPAFKKQLKKMQDGARRDLKKMVEIMEWAKNHPPKPGEGPIYRHDTRRAVQKVA